MYCEICESSLHTEKQCPKRFDIEMRPEDNPDNETEEPSIIGSEPIVANETK